MSNERLRAGFARAGLTNDDVADRAGVDPKTVQRWIKGRVPHPRHRYLVAELLEEDEDFLWPGSRRPDPTASVATELVTAYAYRSELDLRRWWEFFVRAERQIDLLGFTLYFLPQQHPGLIGLLEEKIAAGCQVRAALADPSSPHVQWRDDEEHQAITIKVRIQSALDAFGPVMDHGAEFRFQEAPLYNSIFRFDDEMLVTPHLYATPGHAAPLLHLRRLMPNGLFERFASHFESVWSDAKPMGEDRRTTG